MAGVFDPFLLTLILVGAVVTLINRLAGHFIVARFEPIHYRVEAALEAVPVAVMTTLVVPAAVNGGWIATGALVVWEETSAQEAPPGFALHDARRYGDTHVTLLWRDDA